jgi:7-cyano-7-deazaguanine synthase
MRSVVLLSAGLDSTVNLVRAVKEHTVLLTLTFDYGQRAATKEIENAKKISDLYKIKNQVIDLPWLKAITKTSLVNREINIPVGDELKIDNKAASAESAKKVWVPNRNGVFLNIAASFAEALDADVIIPGFNAEEAVTFADNSPEFLQATDTALSFSTLKNVKTLCYTQNLNKTEIVKLGRELEAPFDLMWPCYFSGETICGECESCLRFNRANAQ